MLNILFLTTGRINDVEEHALYTDLLRTLRDRGHCVYTVSTHEKRVGKPTALTEESGIHTLRVRTGNITKCGLLEKGISTLRIEGQFKRAIKKYFNGVKFDLVLYSTPPITFAKVVQYVKKRDGATSYLLLKDIFPQNAVDIGVLKKSGLKGLLYRFFRRKEKRLYAFSDRIGCMSEANCRYLLTHNPEVDATRVEVCPNSVEVRDMTVSVEERFALRAKYGIPQDKTVFVYGGNLGKPQGVDFLMDCLRREADRENTYFLIVGDGTEYGKLEAFFAAEQLPNAKLLRRLPKEDYDRMVAACDVGLIFLDHRFTIPNFPSRLLSYMQAGVPVLASTDPNTDVGEVIVNGGFGWWCESNDVAAFSTAVGKALSADRTQMGERGRAYMEAHYHVRDAAETLLRCAQND